VAAKAPHRPPLCEHAGWRSITASPERWLLRLCGWQSAAAAYRVGLWWADYGKSTALDKLEEQFGFGDPAPKRLRQPAQKDGADELGRLGGQPQLGR
jgi:hypothetical protein